jgi:hypothetical protein
MNQPSFHPANHKAERLKRAFNLAWFMHGDRELATQIAVNAYEKLEVAAIAQDKRQYYQPGKRGADGSGSLLNRSRRKVSLSELHLLQRLVLLESEPHERQKETALRQLPTPPSTPRLNQIMTVHYLKQLAQITLNRNAFYTTLAFSRLLYNFSTSETMELYAAVTQDSGPGPDDYYYRSRKALLMDELKGRFDGMLKIRRGQRGEERFEAQPDSSKFSELVLDCLQHLAPWGMPGAVPAGYDAEKERLPQLMYDTGDPDERWHQVEITRMHAVMNHESFERLATGLGMAKPTARLELPRFFLAQESNEPEEPPYTDLGPGGGGDGPGGPGSQDAPPDLGSDDFQAMLGELAARAGRRRFTAAGLLRILVDGRERARLDLTQTTQLAFSINARAQLIEVRDGATLLAVLTPDLNDDGEFEPQQYAVSLEGGQQLLFNLTPAADQHATVTLLYRETQFVRAFALWRNRLTYSLAGWFGAAPLPKLAFALLFVLLSVAALLSLRNRPDTKIAQNDGRPTPQTSVPPQPATSPASGQPTPAPPVTPMATVKPPKPIATDPGSTRNGKGRNGSTDARLALANARLVYLMIEAGPATPEEVQALRAALTRSLPAHTPLKLTADEQQADVALWLSIKSVNAVTGQWRITAELRGEGGVSLWPRAGTQSFQGAPAELGEQVAQSLAAALTNAKR